MTMHVVLLVSLFLIYYITGGDRGIYNQSYRKKQVIWMGLVLFLFAALRAYTVGQDVRGDFPDYEGYYYYYTVDASLSFSEIMTLRASRDPFFHIFTKLLSIIWPSPQFMLIVIGAIVAFAFSYFTFKEKGSVLLFFTMFIGFRIFSFTLSGLRQACAISFILIAYIYYKDDKMRKSLLLTLIASLFHRSALIFFVIFLIKRIRQYYVIPILLFIIIIFNVASGGALAEFFALYFYGDRFENYIASSRDLSFEGGTTFYIYMIIYILVFMAYPRLQLGNPSFIIDFNILSLGIFFSILGQSMNNVFRIAYYFIYVLFPTFAQFLILIFKKNLDASFIIFLTSLLLSIQYLVLGTGAGTEDYQFFWNEPYY